ncbi:Sec-independent protein translocase subunit TatA [Brachybacterium sp. DNPG3]
MNLFRNPAALIILLLVVVLLFGAGKLPGLARNLGKSMRIFKSEVEELRGDEAGRDDEDDEDEDDRRDRRSSSSSSRQSDARSSRDREFDPRDEEQDREAVRSRDDDDNTYRRD